MKKLFVMLASVALLCACGDDPVEQSPDSAADIDISVKTMDFLASGTVASGQNQVIVGSSGDWRLTGQKTWCIPSLVKGVNGDTLTFSVDENLSPEPRSIIYTLFCEDRAVKLTVTQYAGNVIDLEQDEFSVVSAGMDLLKIRLLSNLKFTAEVAAEDKTWITPKFGEKTRALESGYFYYSVGANDTYRPRTGKINLVGEGVEPRVISVMQAQNDAIETLITSFKEELEAVTIRMTVWSNVSYELQISDEQKSWITLEAQPEPVTEWSSQELVLRLGAALGYRLGSLNLVSLDKTISVPFAVQQGEPTVFPVPDQLFQGYLVGLGYIASFQDGFVITPAGGAATTLDTYTTLWQQKGCETLAGIEYFTNLTTINCSYNRLRALDISASKISDVAKCIPNALESLVVGPTVTTVNFSSKLYDYNTKVSTNNYSYWAKSFTATGAGITTIDLSTNKLQWIDVSGCPKLATLKCKQTGTTLTTIYMAESQRGKVTITKDTNTQVVYR